LSLAYHWTPSEIVELTPPQLALYLAESVEPASTVAMDVRAGAAYVAQRRAARTNWVDEVLRTRSGHAQAERKKGGARPVVTPEARRVVERDTVRHETHVDRTTQSTKRLVERERAVRELATRTRERLLSSVVEMQCTSLVEQSRRVESSTESAVVLDELRQRMAQLDRTTSEMQDAVERLERKQSDAAHFA
jgi:hypothetical protein